jgi:hypothetical protein
MTAKQILESARNLIADRSHWGQGSLYNEHSGRFCALGAIGRAIGVELDDLDYDLPEQPIKRLARVLGWEEAELSDPVDVIYEYNDKMPHDCVIAAFDKAIAQEAQ